jgi:peptidoglycan/xylan/chitin deacetylase (PgdA/CDA1 family)
VRELRKRGFEIGSHTMNHVDLGKIVGTEAEAEIRGSKQRLVSELGDSSELFSYPYGRIDQLTEDNREAVARAGYRCCISAYGGAVDAKTDPFRVKRTPISPWYQSPYHFGFEALFLKP